VISGLRIALSLLSLWASLAGGAGAQQADRIQIVADPEVLADFALTDQDGRPFKFRSLRGKNTLVFFGFSHCASICPATMLKLKLLTENLHKDESPEPAVVFISVDGDRDTPEVMKEYVGKFSGKFIGLTGDPKTVRTIAVQFKSVFFKGLPSDNSGNYQVEHTSQVYLVDARGRLRARFFDAPVEAMADATRSLGDSTSLKTITSN
jgi:protein SCO1